MDSHPRGLLASPLRKLSRGSGQRADLVRSQLRHETAPAWDEYQCRGEPQRRRIYSLQHLSCFSEFSATPWSSRGPHLVSRTGLDAMVRKVERRDLRADQRSNAERQPLYRADSRAHRARTARPLGMDTRPRTQASTLFGRPAGGVSEAVGCGRRTMPHKIGFLSSETACDPGPATLYYHGARARNLRGPVNTNSSSKQTVSWLLTTLAVVQFLEPTSRPFPGRPRRSLQGKSVAKID
jgi:hypothetical protein